MKLNILFAMLVLSTGLSGVAQDSEHSSNICSTKNAKICGHIGHMSGVTPNKESSFVAHLFVPKGIKVSDFKLSLWMPDMNHGSSDVEISQMGANKYKVTKAVFTMAGSWEVQMKFKVGTEEHQLYIPLKIAP